MLMSIDRVYKEDTEMFVHDIFLYHFFRKDIRTHTMTPTITIGTLNNQFIQTIFT